MFRHMPATVADVSTRRSATTGRGARYVPSAPSRACRSVPRMHPSAVRRRPVWRRARSGQHSVIRAEPRPPSGSPDRPSRRDGQQGREDGDSRVARQDQMRTPARLRAFHPPDLAAPHQASSRIESIVDDLPTPAPQASAWTRVVFLDDRAIDRLALEIGDEPVDRLHDEAGPASRTCPRPRVRRSVRHGSSGIRTVIILDIQIVMDRRTVVKEADAISDLSERVQLAAQVLDPSRSFAAYSK